MEETAGYFNYEVLREGEEVVLRFDCDNWNFLPSLEDSPICMSRTMEKLVENHDVTKIIFYQKRDYEYGYEQARMLAEVAKVYVRLVKQRNILAYQDFGANTAEVRNIVYSRLKSDPIGAYVELKRIARREGIAAGKSMTEEEAAQHSRYIEVLSHITGLLEQTRMIKIAGPHLAGLEPGDRTIYRRFFSATIKPDFMFTKLMASYPSFGEEIDSYSVKDADVTIFRLPETVQYLYHVLPPEFKLSEEKYEILDAARKIISEHKPEKSEFVDPERLRQVFSNVGSDLIEELAGYQNVRLRAKEVEELTNILVRYTIGFGLIEVLLQDEKIQDITINSPMGQSPMFIVHADYGDCSTNIIPTISEGESWASKLRILSGRPLDEANPVLDTELILPRANARVAAIAPPLNPDGLAFALRRHRDKPWTLPLFIKNKMMSPLAAGLVSFLVDGSRTVLVAGTRSAGKTSVLGSLVTEIMRKYRIITVEDTLELPVSSFRKLGYNIQPLKVASAMTKGTTEVAADEGIRTTLRMGDSCLIVGEVRSVEARALYEAMRVGALANVVAGTIHGDSPYGVYDRVVNDLQVPKTSFKATDIIIVANPVRSADGLHRWRRVTQITEVGKYWENDPLLEKGFRDLMKYNTATDSLEPTPDLVNGESDIIKAIAGNVKEWAGNWDAVWDNIQLRANVKQAIVEAADKASAPELLEAHFVVRANDEFHRISDRVRDETGALDSKRILFEFSDWLKRNVRKVEMK